MRQKLKGILGILIMLAALAATYLWVTKGQPALETETLLVAQTDIPKGTVIEDAGIYFKPEKIGMASAVQGALKPEQASYITGRTTEGFIPANGQVTQKSFSENSLILKENQFIFRLPPEWVYTIPSSIRRGDKISIYEIDSRIESRLSAGEEAETVLKGGYEAILETTVEYVKDGTNREVTDTNGSKRLDGTSQVSAIEIICTRKETQVLESSILAGKKLIVVYR
ncbi:hypothetical protein LY28_03745 [Ruminiclostridium sufflavum DSM 19573]|uniref:SAF domain-containing protein n=1 Tax=Ruminiclostridium sufflavum DSM 19573 TaxID=1121337 RepID=A0A318XRQ4_9FIRM|nr:hypothetical protein [Ruminiclostridium sufflavum]PYG84240.1 hypothetical protein LY28_03745 [Ruminiclostridium sufflavum DSM 19573]